MSRKLQPSDAIFCRLLKINGLPKPEAEYQFHPTRKWRFDYCWPDLKLALEVEGAVWTSGRHTRGSGFLKDVEKYNAAASLGYRLLRCTPDQLCTMETIELVEKSLEIAA